MRSTRIYTPQPLQVGTLVTLESDASHHLLKVLRAKTDTPVTLFNGEKGEFHGRLSATSSKKQANIQIDTFDPVSRESSLQIEIAIGISRNDRLDWALQKATELGATGLHVIITDHSNTKLNHERLNKRMQHWQQIVISACEQSQRTKIPKVQFHSTLNRFVEECHTQTKYVLHHKHSHSLRKDIDIESMTLLIGPEGGLSPEEIQHAEENGFIPLVLGPRVMRTETAPVAALSIMQYLYGDFSSTSLKET